jgi:hypothetical protein
MPTEGDPQAVRDGAAAARPVRRRQERQVQPEQFMICVDAVNRWAAAEGERHYDPCGLTRGEREWIDYALGRR